MSLRSASDLPDTITAADKDRPPLFRDTTEWYAGISAFWFATSLKWFILFLFLPLRVGDIVPGGAKNGAWGMVVALGAAEAMIGPAIAGYLSDRCTSRFGRRRPFIAIGAGLTALALLFLGGANSLPLLVFAYLALQISDDIGTGPYAAIIPDVVPEEHRGKASGVMSVLQLVAQIVAVGVALTFGKNFLFLCAAIAVINVVCALVVCLTVREGPYVAPPAAPRSDRDTDLPSRMKRGFANWLAPFQVPDFRWVWVTRFLVALGFYLILLYVSNYLTDRVQNFSLPGLNLGSSQNPDPKKAKSAVQYASLAAALTISLAGAVASGFAGKLSDRLGRKRVIVLSGYVMFASIVPFAFLPVYSLLIALAFVFGIGYGAYLSASWALAADVLPSKEDAAKDMGIWQASVSTPQILGGVVGFLVDMGNKQSPGAGYTIAFLIAAVVFLAGCVFSDARKGFFLKFFLPTEQAPPEALFEDVLEKAAKRASEQWQTYRAHMDKIEGRLPPRFAQYLKTVHLGDAKVKSLSIDTNTQNACLSFLAGNVEHTEFWQVDALYRDVRQVRCDVDERYGVGGLPGFGNLLNDEADIATDGVFEHRMIFSSGTEIAIQFATFDFTIGDITE